MFSVVRWAVLLVWAEGMVPWPAEISGVSCSQRLRVLV